MFAQAKECERMFTLVKQAHEKVAAKDKEYTAKMEEQKKKYLEEIQALEQQCINLKACTIM